MTGAVNLANWTLSQSDPSSILMAMECPSSSQNCWKLCGKYSNSSDAYMYTMASTIGYQQIELTYSIGLTGLKWLPDHCEIYYTLDSKTSSSDWIFIDKYSKSYGNIIGRVHTFDSNADIMMDWGYL